MTPRHTLEEALAHAPVALRVGMQAVRKEVRQVPAKHVQAILLNVN